MSAYRLLKHKNFDHSAKNLPRSIRQKALWAQVLLGTRGRTPSVKGTTGTNARWRRTPVQGNHYYMWWIPQSESGLTVDANAPQRPSILIHSIRHHDQTDAPIRLGSLRDYEEIAVTDLDPRFDEQHAISRQLDEPNLSLATIKGLPGSGKTVSLLYLVRDIIRRTYEGELLYITYTPRLKRAAQEFLQAHDESIRERVRFCTLSEIESAVTGVPVHAAPFSALEQFEKAVRAASFPTLGPWKKYPQTLYTEIRAHLLGRAFPAGYAPPEPPNQAQRTQLHAFSAAEYAAMRDVDLGAAEIAYRIAARVANERFFREQKAANLALTQLMHGQYPAWLSNLSAIVVDEIQDLTLLQIAFLGELARLRAQQILAEPAPTHPFIFTVAGDESQIVQPSGFDWGVTKDLLGEQMGTWPEEFEFRHQRRSPHHLTQVIDSSWNFYRHLPKTHRPSAQRQSFADESMEDAQHYAEGGTLFLCTPAPEQDEPTSGRNEAPRRPQADWITLIDELNDKPGRVVIDVTELLQHTLPAEVRSLSSEVLFLPRDIKGLERATVIVHGLDEMYRRALHLCEEAALSDDNIPRFEARRLFDEMRVALSRSTHTLILLEPPDAPVLAELGILESSPYAVIDWDDLIDMLRTEEMSELEIIEGYLDEVDDLLERERWEQAYRRNRRAYELACRLDDSALQREAQEQFIAAHLQEADSLIDREAWQPARARNQQANQLAHELGDSLWQERVADQASRLRQTIGERVQRLQTQAQEWAGSNSYNMAQRDARAACELAAIIEDAGLVAQSQDTLADICWQWAFTLTGPGASETNARKAAQLLEEAAHVIDQQAQSDTAQALRVLAQRYRQAPQIGTLSKKQVGVVLEQAQKYLAIMESLDAEQDAYTFIERWLDEAFEGLRHYSSLYYTWATTAARLAAVAIYENYDENLWDLENRAEMVKAQTHSERRALAKFQAFALGYNGEAEKASAAWEALDELGLAAEQARHAGLIERAYQLLRRAKEPVPDDLATAARTLRLVAQLAHKHAALTPAEKQTLLAEMRQLEQTLGPKPDETR